MRQRQRRRDNKERESEVEREREKLGEKISRTVRYSWHRESGGACAKNRCSYMPWKNTGIFFARIINFSRCQRYHFLTRIIGLYYFPDVVVTKNLIKIVSPSGRLCVLEKYSITDSSISHSFFKPITVHIRIWTRASGGFGNFPQLPGGTEYRYF